MNARAREFAVGYPEFTFIEDNFLTADLPAAGFDFIRSVTTIHHMDFEAALIRMCGLLRSGGTLVVVGLAREASVTEWAAMIAGAPVVRLTKVLRRARGPQGIPVERGREAFRLGQVGLMVPYPRRHVPCEAGVAAEPPATGAARPDELSP